MTNRQIGSLVLIGLMLAGPGLAEEIPGMPPEGLLEPATSAGWTAWLVTELGTRRLETGADTSQFDIDRVFGRVGHDLGPAAHVYGEIGGVLMGRDGESGDGGLHLGAGATVTLLQLDVRRPTPTASSGSTLGVGLDIAGAYVASDNVVDRDLAFTEIRGGPSVTYAIRWNESGRWQGYGPRVATLKGGVVGSWIDGEYGDDDVQADREVGLGVSSAMLFDNLWALDLAVTWFDTGDASLAIGLGHGF